MIVIISRQSFYYCHRQSLMTLMKSSKFCCNFECFVFFFLFFQKKWKEAKHKMGVCPSIGHVNVASKILDKSNNFLLLLLGFCFARKIVRDLCNWIIGRHHVLDCGDDCLNSASFSHNNLLRFFFFCIFCWIFVVYFLQK